MGRLWLSWNGFRSSRTDTENGRPVKTRVGPSCSRERHGWFAFRTWARRTNLHPHHDAHMHATPRLLCALVLLGACAKEHENVVHVIAEQAPGLKRNARVQYRGVDVGYVKQVYFTPGGVRIDALLQRNDVPIRTQDTVRITQVGAFGEQVIDIRPGLQTAPLVAHGATLQKAQPDSSVSVPIGVWRSVVQTLGIAADSAKADTGIVRVMPGRARDSASRP